MGSNGPFTLFSKAVAKMIDPGQTGQIAAQHHGIPYNPYPPDGLKFLTVDDNKENHNQC